MINLNNEMEGDQESLYEIAKFYMRRGESESENACWFWLPIVNCDCDLRFFVDLALALALALAPCSLQCKLTFNNICMCIELRTVLRT